MNELVSIIKNGSWFEVAWYEYGSLMTKKVQGYKNALKFIKYACIKHTIGSPLAFDKSLINLVNYISVDPTLTDKEAWSAIDKKFPMNLFD